MALIEINLLYYFANISEIITTDAGTQLLHQYPCARAFLKIEVLLLPLPLRYLIVESNKYPPFFKGLLDKLPYRLSSELQKMTRPDVSAISKPRAVRLCFVFRFVSEDVLIDILLIQEFLFDAINTSIKGNTVPLVKFSTE